MSLIQRAVSEAGLELERDVPIPGQRRVRDWAKLIGMARKLESQDGEVLEIERTRAADLMEKNLRLQSEVFSLRERVSTFELRARMSDLHIEPSDQQALLGSSSA